MLVKIKDGFEVNIEVGDTILPNETLIDCGCPKTGMLVIGWKKHRVVYTYDECKGPKLDTALIQEYNIDPKWDGHNYFTTTSKYIVGVIGITTPIQNTSCQHQAAAWGKKDHTPPSDAAFKFL